MWKQRGLESPKSQSSRNPGEVPDRSAAVSGLMCSESTVEAWFSQRVSLGDGKVRRTLVVSGSEVTKKVRLEKC